MVASASVCLPDACCCCAAMVVQSLLLLLLLLLRVLVLQATLPSTSSLFIVSPPKPANGQARRRGLRATLNP